MVSKLITSILLALTIAACFPHVSKLSQSPSVAGREAQRFAEVAFVERDFGKGYELLAEGGRRFGSGEQFKEFIIKKHPNAFPSFVNATDYEPVVGQSKINVYLYGENGAEKFYYRMIMEGSQDRGYKVSGFDRGNSPYPATDLRRPLK